MDGKLKPGTDLAEAIERRAGTCDVLIAVIGRHWLGAVDETGKRQLDHLEDVVRIEVGAALRRGIHVIPVLVEGALMPRLGELPDELKPLVRRRALSVGPGSFPDDSESLIDAIKRALKGARIQERRKREEQERVGVERGERQGQERQQAKQGDKTRLEAQRREHEEGEHLERARPQPVLGPSPSKADLSAPEARPGA